MKFGDAAGWVLNSCRLVVRKPLHWLFGVYVTFIVVALIIPHAFGPMGGLVGIALYLALVFFLMPSTYFAFADVFGHRASRETPWSSSSME